MRKLLILIVFSLLYFSCAEAPSVKDVVSPDVPDAPDSPVISPEDPFPPFNDQKLGDMVTINLTDNGNGNYTYDYTGLGINDDYEVELTASYFLDNISSTIENNTSILFKAKTALWIVNGKSYGAVDSSYYKQSFDVPNVSTNIQRVSIVLKHISYVDSLLSENYYFYKGLNNGSGEMELVGRIINNSGGSTSEGDTHPFEPYNP